jgi:hypothetical protein
MKQNQQLACMKTNKWLELETHRRPVKYSSSRTNLDSNTTNSTQLSSAMAATFGTAGTRHKIIVGIDYGTTFSGKGIPIPLNLW